MDLVCISLHPYLIGRNVLSLTTHSIPTSDESSQNETKFWKKCNLPKNSFQFFTFKTKLPEMVKLASKDFKAAEKKLPPVGLDQEFITGVRV